MLVALFGLEDDAIKKLVGEPYPRYMMTNMVYLNTFMTFLGIDKVHYLKTYGNMNGVLLSPYYWNDSHRFQKVCQTENY